MIETALPLRSAAGRPTREHAAARQEELLETALDMFLERGFEQTTIEAVAAAVGMTKRTVYARHQDKAALFKAAVSRAVERMAMPPEALAALDTHNLEEALVAVARMRVAQVMTPIGLKLQRIINTESYRFPEIFTMAYEQGAGPVVRFLAQLLRQHDTAGAVCVADPDMAANIFMSMVIGGPVRFTVSGSSMAQAEIDARIGFAVALFLNGVRRR